MRTLKVVWGVAAAVSLAVSAWAQGNPRGTASLDLNGTKISVEYGRPSLHGKTVEDRLGELPVGEFWRLGADKSTTFSTSGDLVFGDVTIPKGEYSLWVLKDKENSFQLVFNKQHGQWGTDHDPSKDFAKIPLKVEKEGPAAEQVTITLEKEGDGGELSIRWGDMELTTNFKTK